MSPNPADSHFSFISPEMTIDASLSAITYFVRESCAASLCTTAATQIDPGQLGGAFSEQEFNDLLVPTSGKFYQGEVEGGSLR